MVITLHLCVFEWLSEQAVTFVLYISDRLVFMTEMESVYCAVRNGCLYNTDVLFLKELVLSSLVPLITSSGISPWDITIITLCVFLHMCIRATWYAHLIIYLVTLTSD